MPVTEGADAVALRSGGGGSGETGDFAWSARSSKAGHVLCDGTAYDRTDPNYAPLFAIIGTTWGAGNGSTTFNVPELRGRTLVAAGGGPGLSVRTVGERNGLETTTLAIANMPAHSHGGQTNGQLGTHTHPFSTSVNGNHDHRGATTNLTAWSDGAQGFAMNNQHWGFQTTDRTGVLTFTGAISFNGDHSHTGTTSPESQAHQHTIASEGSGSAFTNMPPFGVANLFIKL